MGIGSVIAVLGSLPFQANSAAEPPNRAITVLVFDYAGLPAGLLDAGSAEAQRILKSGAVEVAWVRCPTDPDRLALDITCRAEPGPLTLVLQILPPKTTKRDAGADAAGFAVPAQDSDFGTYAGVYYERVQQIGRSLGERAALGHVIAHELGHLLLGTGGHSAAGIMRADWRHGQIVLAAQGSLGFDGNERRRILTNLQGRMLAARPGLPESASRRRQ